MQPKNSEYEDNSGPSTFPEDNERYTGDAVFWCIVVFCVIMWLAR